MIAARLFRQHRDPCRNDGSVWARLARLVGGLLVIVVGTTTADANVVIEATRVIYEQGAQSQIVQLTNRGDQPALVQSWVDAGNTESTPEDSQAPFVILPPITRVEAERGQALRIRFTGTPKALPSDEESVFWLNVLDVPPSLGQKQTDRDKNYLQFAIRSRIKLFYRPKGLPGEPRKAPDALEWSVTTNTSGSPVLRVHNPSAYHVTLTAVRLGKSGSSLVPRSHMLAPGASHRWPLGMSPAAGARVVYESINDFGAATRHDAALAAAGD